ncbi:hypothetical protein UFOVP953_6 [uncultured Caudovirales phage]|uniref:DNA transfer protein n=1 Tax=uncultured Caudovirales phage TaxID=2100421 RepID=A0A6J5PNP3_9CAUD|nr:hypothetical protein UFOVP953_6 [uncultured Caudovirales phage]
MTWVTAAVIGGSAALNAYTASKQADAAKQAAQMQADAANRAMEIQQAQFDRINEQQRPQRELGYKGVSQISDMMPYLTKQFGPQDLQAGLAPNYDFMLSQGQGLNAAKANQAGGMIGGNALQGLNQFTQDYAQNAYQNAFNNYQTGQTNIYNRLAGIAGIGQTAQGAVNAAGSNLANNLSSLGVGSAAATGSGLIGAANAYSNAGSNIANNATLASLMYKPAVTPQGQTITNQSAVGAAGGLSGLPSDWSNGGTGLQLRTG